MDISSIVFLMGRVQQMRTIGLVVLMRVCGDNLGKMIVPASAF